MGILQRLRESLQKTQARLRDQLILLFTGRLIDEAFWDQLVELLIAADIHYELAEAMTRETRRRAERALIREPPQVLPVLVDVLTERLTVPAEAPTGPGPHVYFFVGVNGTGKTTTIAKMAYLLKGQGRSVLLCAADTFRAAAIDQLAIWAERLGVPVIAHQAGGDPGAVLFDALQALKARKLDVLLVDTAGRLHTKVNLMRELEKLNRIARQQVEGAPHETFLVLDATMGQNALQQARVFREATPLTGLILTKLDGTAKGGAVLSIVDQLKVPVRFLGVGEKATDLVPFSPREFAQALVGSPEEWVG
ncbi:MAG: signal recognition particle-docking protein FtsY [Acidobacteria bacterium]|nr:signal recognition particle-docking protein FtsY [Acidobacteriota bacterium]MDW7985021.1 signal recognition particle-docking protein FtsY [Acidobacteriota bacterium]